MHGWDWVEILIFLLFFFFLTSVTCKASRNFYFLFVFALFFSALFFRLSFLSSLFFLFFCFLFKSLSMPLPPSLSLSHGSSFSHGHIEGPGLLKWTLVSFTSYTPHSYTLHTAFTHQFYNLSLSLSLSLSLIFLTWTYWFVKNGHLFRLRVIPHKKLTALNISFSIVRQLKSMELMPNHDIPGNQQTNRVNAKRHYSVTKQKKRQDDKNNLSFNHDNKNVNQ